MSRQDIVSAQKAEDFGNVHMTLAEKIARWTKDSNKFTTAIPTLSFSRYEGTTEPTCYLLEPSICLVAQGAKRVLLGEDTHV